MGTIKQQQCLAREADGRPCRNKALDGGPYFHRCKKHSIEALRDFELQNRQLTWYLKYRHLLDHEEEQ